VMFQLFGNAILSALGIIMGGLMVALSAIAKVCSAHTLLITLLLLSGGINFFFSSRESWMWWHERNAGKFMSRIGVGPSTTMSRSIYLRDIEDSFLFSNDTAIDFAASHGEANKCQQTFTDLLLSPETFSPPHSSRRIHRTRHHLGHHRHDLLVALRVVNRIEKEVLEAEYENWLFDETQKCQQIGALLNESESSSGNGKKKRKEKEKGKASAVDDWMKGYCGDCEVELSGVKRRARGLI
jgi:hypothetical protein